MTWYWVQAISFRATNMVESTARAYYRKVSMIFLTMVMPFGGRVPSRPMGWNTVWMRHMWSCSIGWVCPGTPDGLGAGTCGGLP